MQTAIDKFDKNEFIKNKITSSTTEGFIVEGEIFHVCPYNLRMYLELDTPAGICGKIFLGFMAQLGKWGLVRHKVEEWMEASPANPGSYQATIQQKQQIEAQIKSGLAGISSAVSDFELLFHDLRKYRDFMQHFEKIEKGKRDKKPELVAEGTQTLKAVFIDQVDVHTGEGIAMKMIAPRWPTIIADFMKLTEKDIDQKKISERYQVSEAEGVVLATKNKLFLEWFNTFKATVLDRYERIKGLMEARKKSIEEYKNILKPYITRYRYLRELGESPEGRRLLEGLGWLRPQGQLLINTMEFQTVWVWKPFFPPDLYKSAAEPLVVKKNIFRMPFPREFKNWIREEFKTNKKLREKYSEVETSQTGIEPLDIYVMALIPEIEKAWNVKLTLEDILETREKFMDQWNPIKTPQSFNWVKSPYFMVLDLNMNKAAYRVDGSDFESMTFDRMRGYMDTQNVILLRMLELKAKSKELENYISDMLGETAGSKKIADIIKGEFPYMLDEDFNPELEKKPAELKKVEVPKAEVFIRRDLGLDLRFFKPGNYEPHLEDRITEIYLKEVAEVLFLPAVKFWKTAGGVPGF